MLEHDDNTALLISRYILDIATYYEDEERYYTIPVKSLRKCLDQIIEKLPFIEVITKFQPVRQDDKYTLISVLSAEEALKYYKSLYQSRAVATDYVKMKCKEEVLFEDAAFGYYWLKDVSENGADAAYINCVGELYPAENTIGLHVYDIRGVRPIIRINLSVFEEGLKF